MYFDQHFTLAGVTTDALIQKYGVLFKEQHRGLSEEERVIFSAIREELISNRLQLIEITSDAKDEDLTRQLVGKDVEGHWRDKVHSFGIEDLNNAYKFRIGGANANKTVYALVHPNHPEGRKVMAAIYVNRRFDLASNVDEILKADLSSVSGFQYVVPYSISSFKVMPGEGQLLIFAIHRRFNQELPPEVKITTLSPFRTFARRMSQLKIPFCDLSKQERKFYAVDYVRSNHDGVGKFHRGNGAIALEIHEGANIPGSEDDSKGLGMMINYFYPRNEEQLLGNIGKYRAGDYDELMAPRLREIANLPRAVQGVPRLEKAS